MELLTQASCIFGTACIAAFFTLPKKGSVTDKGRLPFKRSDVIGAAYLALLVFTAPLALMLILPFVAYALALHLAGRNVFTRDSNSSKFGRKTVLVTGAPHTKGLQVCRYLKSVGHRVLLADMEEFKLSASRFSRAVDGWTTLPSYYRDPEGYSKGIVDLIKREKVDWWIPISHTVTAQGDCKTKELLAEMGSPVKVLSYDSFDTVKMLDDKMAFMKDCGEVGLAVPGFRRIATAADVERLHAEGLFKDRYYFLKPDYAYSEDRVCFDRIPHAKAEFEAYMRKYGPKITPKTPYFACEYIDGPEWTGACAVSEGRIAFFVACPSSPMQIDYTVAKDKETIIYDWVERYCRARKLTGNICFDFMEDLATGRMVGIECNPRQHSCCVLLRGRLQATGEAFGRALEGDLDGPPESSDNPAGYLQAVVPGADQAHVMWAYNEIGKLAHVKSLGEALEVFRTLATSEDAVFHLHDPMPFFLLGHLQMPSRIYSVLRSGRKWNILNFCLGQLR